MTHAVAQAAERVLRQQVDAFNAHDLEGFVASYSTDAAIHGVSAHPLRGSDALRAHYQGRLADVSLHCEILEIVSWPDGWLVARERVTSSAGTADVTALFAVDGDVITRAYIGV